LYPSYFLSDIFVAFFCDRDVAYFKVRCHVMPRDTLQEIATLLEQHNASSNNLAIALLGDHEKMWRYLVSNELWGGAGSVADQALLDAPDARRQLEDLLILLGREQMDLGHVNVRTEMWVTVFEKWRAAGIR
jgi:hypothetical protein